MGSIKATPVDLQLALSNDIDSAYDAGYKSMDQGVELVKKGIAMFKDASVKFQDAQNKSDQAIAMAKELGVDTKQFDTKKLNAKNAQGKADKNAGVTVLS